MVRVEKGAQKKQDPIMTKKREVLDFFARLHGHLQQQEEAALRAVNALLDRKVVEMTSYENKLTAQIKEANAMLGKAEAALTEQSRLQTPNVPLIHSCLQNLSKCPCHLVRNSFISDSSLILKESVWEELKDLVTVQGNLSEYSLLAEDELPEGYIMPDLGTQLLAPLEIADTDDTSNHTGASVISEDSETSCSKRMGSKRGGSEVSGSSYSSNHDSVKKKTGSIDTNALKQKSTPRTPRLQSQVIEISEPHWVPDVDSRFKNGMFVGVKVCYVVNPGLFFIHTEADEFKSESLQRRIDAQIAAAKKITKIASGDFILAQYSKMWYRAQVDKVSGRKVRVTYVDYGNQSVVDLTDLRRPTNTSIFYDEQPLAIPCSIYNVVPNKSQWCDASIKAFTKTVTNQGSRIMMFVIRQSGVGLEVDLTVHLNDTFGREVVSVRDYLLFSRLASVLSSGLPDPPRDLSTCTPTLYRRRKIPEDNDFFKLIVTWIVNPSNFYFYRAEVDHPYLKDMECKMKEVYGNMDSAGQKAVIQVPYNDMPCAVKDPSTQTWRRGRVLLAEHSFKVHLVDYGQILSFDLKNVRRLHPCFLKCPPMSIRARLADTTPVNGQWSSKASNYFRSLVLNKTSRGYVVSSKNETVCLHLFEDDEAQTPINRQLTTEGFAEEIFSLDVDTEQLQFSKTKKGNFRKSRIQPVAPVVPKVREIVEEVKEAPEAVGIEVKVIHVRSPALIYFGLNTYDEALYKICADLKEVCHSTLPVMDVKWTVGQDCAFYCNQRRRWLRGCVEDVSGIELKVMATDLMEVKDVDPSNVRELPEDLKETKIVFKCHMVGIKPPGSKWTSLASEELEELFRDAENLFIAKKGEITGQSLPAEFFIQETIMGGALKPTRIIYRSVNETLVKKGLAYKVDGYELGKFGPTPKESSGTPSCVTSFSTSLEPAPNPNRDAPVATTMTVLPSVSQDWLPPPTFSKKRVLGYVTHVDERGVLYFQDNEIVKPLVDRIQKELTDIYSNTRPNHKDQFWTVGQICAARYYLDGTWNRGKILKVGLGNSRTYLVLFVDYGNIETCQVTDLRKGITFLEIPIASHTCYVADLRPVKGSVYSKDAIDMLHALAVEREFLIDILDNTEEPLPANLTWVKSADDVFETMVARNMAVRVTSLKPVTFPSRDISGSENLENMDVNTPTALVSSVVPGSSTSKISVESVKSETGTELFLSKDPPALNEEMQDGEFHSLAETEVIHPGEPFQLQSRPWNEIIFEEEQQSEVSSWHGQTLEIPCFLTNVTLTVTHLEGETLMTRLVVEPTMEEELQGMIELGLAMEAEMQAVGPFLPRLSSPSIGSACVTLHNDKYYRAVVESVDATADRFNVLFVDYGIRSSVPASRMAFCRKEWLMLPSLAVPMKLDGFVRDDILCTTWPSAVMDLLNGMAVVAEVVKRCDDFFIVKMVDTPGGVTIYESVAPEPAEGASPEDSPTAGNSKSSL